MLTFVHLSDIHFRTRDEGTQFDLDGQIRDALLEDLASKPAEGANYNGILITGDIAFGGKHEEYKTAQRWLDQVFERTGASVVNTYVVPGNHDIDRSFVEPDVPLWMAHATLRKVKDSVTWNSKIYTQLMKDPQHALIGPLSGYNGFAQGYGCLTSERQLAWTEVFNEPLEDGSYVRLHGLNSALISDAGDAPGGLLLSSYQTSHFNRAPGMVDLVMCHHPPEWLMDKHQIKEVLDSFAQIALFGHEHTTRITAEKDLVQLFAGAVQPSRRDAGHWLPTYHILQISIDHEGGKRELLVRIHTREYSTEGGHRFRARRNKRDEPVDEHRIVLPPWTAPQISPPASAPSNLSVSGLSSENVSTAAHSPAPSPAEFSQRELLVHFFRLGTPLRYAVANEVGLLRDGDDLLQPQVMWTEVFKRAADEGRLRTFWEAVAKRSASLSATTNPF